MSLINQMLNDLEARQARLDESAESALNGLHGSEIYEYEEDNSRPRLLFMMLSIILISLMIYGLTRLFSQEHLDMQNLAASARWDRPVSETAPLTGPAGANLAGDNIVRHPDYALAEDGARDHVSADMNATVKVEMNNAAADLSGRDSPATELSKAPNMHFITGLTLAQTIALPEKPRVQSETGAAGAATIASLKVIEDDDISIEMRIAGHPEYSLFTLEDPDRLVVQIRDYDVPDISALEPDLPRSVKFRTRREGMADTQLIFEFPQTVNLLDTRVDELSDDMFLSIRLAHRTGDTGALTTTMESDTNIGTVDDLFIPGQAEVVLDEPRLEKKVLQEDAVRRSDDLYTEGRTAGRTGEITTAIDRYYSAISSHEQNHRARLALVETLLGQGDEQAARSLLVRGLELNPGHAHMARLLAGLLAQEGNNRMALYYLERAIPELQEDVEYHALVAALLQREGRHVEAIAFYRNVLSVHSGNGLWWMGLGISLEATGSGHQALLAYQRARQDANLTTSIAKYLDSRISSLNKKLQS